LSFQSSSIAAFLPMGVRKTIIREGSGPRPKKGQMVTMQYRGYLKDSTQPGNKGWS
jgi:FK506-binding protein 1